MHTKIEFQRSNSRSVSGSLGSLLIAALIPVLFGLGAFALDYAHVETVRGELQRATDAAALAGAADLTVDQSNVDADALQIAGDNNADGRAVSNLTSGMVVTSLPTYSTTSSNGSEQVSATATIQHTFARIFGDWSSTTTVTSTAGAGGNLKAIGDNQAFPLAVSIDTKSADAGGKGNGGGTPAYTGPLYNARIGDTVVFYINAQKYKNAAFTSLTEKNTNANWITSAIDQSLGITRSVPGFIPGCKTGDALFLDNGVSGQKTLASDPELSKLQAAAGLVLPVMSGDPPYNQSRTCIGFITVHVTSVQINQSGGNVEAITCQLVKGLADGTDGSIPSVDNGGNIDKALAADSTSAVKLIQ